MTDHMNGPPAEPTDGVIIPPSQSQLDAQLDAMLFPMLNVVIRGAMVSVQGCPPEKIVFSACRILGKIVGISFSAGDLAKLLRARKEAKDDFNDAVKSIPLASAGPMSPIPRPPGAA